MKPAFPFLVRLCATSFITQDSCNALERGNSPIRCQRVTDTVECAIKLAEGKADFGVFTADEVLLTHHFYPSGVQVVAELKNKDNMKAYGKSNEFIFLVSSILSIQNFVNQSFECILHLFLLIFDCFRAPRVPNRSGSAEKFHTDGMGLQFSNWVRLLPSWI